MSKRYPDSAMVTFRPCSVDAKKRVVIPGARLGDVFDVRSWGIEILDVPAAAAE